MNQSAIACFGQSANDNRIFFIAKSNNAYYLDSYDATNKLIQSSVPLSTIQNIPSAIFIGFEGQCTYADDSSSFYLNFKNGISSTIYQLPVNQTLAFKEASVTLNNTEVSSIQYITDSNNQPQLAYVGTLSNQQKILGIVSLIRPTLNPTYKSISELGTLAASNTPTSRNLYLIQSNSIDVYRLLQRQHSHAVISTDLFNGTQKGTTGQVFVSSSMEYIPIYQPTTGMLKVFAHNTSLSNYATLPIVNGQISLSDQSTPTTNVTAARTIASIEAQPKSEVVQATPIADPKPNQKASKRSVTTTTKSDPLTDTAYSAQSFKITNSNSESSPDAVILLPNTDTTASNNLFPFEYGTIAVNDKGDATVSVQKESSSIAADKPSASSTANENNTSNGNSSTLSGGAIAGIVVGSVAFLFMVIVALFCFKRHRAKKQRKLKTREMLRVYSGSKDFKGDTILPSNIQELHKTASKESYGQSFIAMQDSKSVLDDARPDIKPLCYTKDAIDYAQLPEQELVQLEPGFKGPLYLFSGLYTSPENECVHQIKDGYVARTFRSEDGQKHTMHYFSAAQAQIFIRSVYASLRISSSGKSTYTIKSERAIVLSSPTPYSGYQYIWITSPVMPDHSLHHLLFENNVWSFIDYHSLDYKIWSVFAILKSIESVHSQGFVHLAVEPKSFYFEHEMNATDWHLGQFGYTHALFDQQALLLPLPTPYMAPELIEKNDASIFLEKSLDIWSLGCVIYTVVTSGLVLFSSSEQVKELLATSTMDSHIEKAMQGTIENNVFAKLLSMMLCVDPKERKTITEIVAYWHSVYNMEE